MSRIVRWNPLVDVFDDAARFFEDGTVGSFAPAIDVYQEGSDVVVKTSLPGIDPKDLSISVENDVLVLQGKTERKSEIDEKNYYRKEIRAGSFYRSVALPEHVDDTKAAATYEKGVLTVRLPKSASGKPKSIPITTAGA